MNRDIIILQCRDCFSTNIVKTDHDPICRDCLSTDYESVVVSRQIAYAIIERTLTALDHDVNLTAIARLLDSNLKRESSIDPMDYDPLGNSDY